MLDLNFVRENLEEVREALKKRNANPDVLDDFTRLDTDRREVIGKADDVNRRRNESSKEIGALMQQGKREEAEEKKSEVAGLKGIQAELEEKRKELEAAMDDLLSGIPNVPADDVPVGVDESDNVEVRKWGEPTEFDFEPLDHVDIGENAAILDLERATKIAGTRFAILKGAGARLERALINFMLDFQTTSNGYEETHPPFIVNRNTLFGTGQLPKFEQDLFHLEDERGFALIPTAEVPVTNYYGGEILEAKDLPINFAAYTPCFRSEAGSYGRDTRGLIRQHQFEKVELVKITLPERSWEELEKLTANAEAILQMLELPYRVVVLSTGDLGFASAKTYDLEVWIPSQETYREISSCSNCLDFQSRRMNLRFRRAGGEKPEFAHTLNGSSLAVGRTWIAILENYQQEDGSVIIPEVLKPYMNGIEKIEPAS
ncbi:MAG: serine--tRNA ligase [Acidobacteria bacterium]|nr:MAG: serine--tRNA ligase [Acidobacteriota bacterium]REK02849.1 MAG: serine--tRNA ligase [Acidobacteriota bacterium]REK13347.1 MAG: serine--tRNA ligase [Acidobacteriota bacterium]REK41341.1 MAG: serine--tRNA ligase [Acidobacteriota bacterium]